MASLEGLAPFQIAFVVHDLKRAAREFDEKLSAGPWRGWVFGPQGQGREYHGRPAAWTLRLALNDRSPQYELIQPLDGPSIHGDWLEQHGEGFHHVGYIVPSLQQTTVEMEAPVIRRSLESTRSVRRAMARPPATTRRTRSASSSKQLSRRSGCRRRTSCCSRGR